jgi:deoxycytidylate deaminase
MYKLLGIEEQEAIKFMEFSAKIAQKATCKRKKCGSIIVKDNEIIGEGFNSPPGNLDNQCRCQIKKSEYDIKLTDKTCCVHAEQRAIMDALKTNPSKVEGSRLYFMKIDKEGKATKVGKPYCTICSKMALDVGIKEFILWHEDGIYVYNTEEYNDLSFKYKSD